jgi:hypothetical protein
MRHRGVVRRIKVSVIASVSSKRRAVTEGVRFHDDDHSPSDTAAMVMMNDAMPLLR